jgi:hypothetical protein
VIARLGPEYDFAIKRMRAIASRSVGQDLDDTLDPSQLFSDTRYQRMYLNPQNDCYRCYGWIDDASGALCSIVTVKEEPLRGTWLLQWLGSDVRLDNGRPLNGVFDLLDHVLRANEARGMNAWVGCIPAHYERVYDRLWRQHCPAYRGYEIESCVRVPAGSVPASSEHFTDLFGCTIQAIDMLVRRHIRKPSS